MWRWTRRIAAGLVVLLTVVAIGGAVFQSVSSRRDLAATPPPGRLVDVGGHRLHIWCMGSGDPVVVFDSGLGGTSFDSYAVMTEVSRITKACAYDRAGMGYSDPGPTPRTSRRIASELAELLTRSGIDRSVVLVGTSFGGFNVRVFASEREARVAGLVLVEASHEDQGARYAAVGAPSAIPPYGWLVPWAASLGVLRLSGVTLGPSPDSAPGAVRPFVRATVHRTTRYKTMYDELMHTRESGEEVRATRRELTIPVVVVTGGVRSGPTAEVHSELQRDQLRLSRRSCQIIAERSGHAVREAAVVAKAIRAALEASKSSTKVPTCF